MKKRWAEWPRMRPYDLTTHILPSRVLGLEVDSTSQGIQLSNLFSATDSANHYGKKIATLHENKIHAKVLFAIRTVNEQLAKGEMSFEQAFAACNDWIQEISPILGTLKELSSGINLTLNHLDRKPVLQLVHDRETA